MDSKDKELTKIAGVSITKNHVIGAFAGIVLAKLLS